VSWLREGAFFGLRVGLPVISLSGNNLGQVVCARATVTKQYNLVPVKGRWCHATGKVTVGLASHWPCVADFSYLCACGSRPKTARWDEHPAYAHCGVCDLYLMTVRLLLLLLMFQIVRDSLCPQYLDSFVYCVPADLLQPDSPSSPVAQFQARCLLLPPLLLSFKYKNPLWYGYQVIIFKKKLDRTSIRRMLSGDGGIGKKYPLPDRL